MQKQRSLLALIFVLIIAAITIIVTIPTRLGLDLQGGSQLTIQIKTTKEIPKIEERDLEAVKRIIENRVNGLGVSEAVVQTVGNDQILVQLPGVSDPQQAERVLGGTAQLDFRRETQQERAFLDVRQIELGELLQKQQELQAKGDTKVIADNQAAIDKKNQEIKQLTTNLYERTELTGKNLKDAFATSNSLGNTYAVALRFDSDGAQKFADLTKNIAGTKLTLGIFLDNELISAATVSSEYKVSGITGGSAEISGNFTAQKANDLAVQLRGGALPLPVEIIENRTVGASLGRDSIQSSIYAGIGGLTLVLIFMVAYYRLPGVIADIALLIYALLTWACFVLLGVTLTLPGIAGFVLSIGMAVDANVLIFERTREELQAGKTLYRSVESGFYRAFSSILDGNVTTVIACAALFYLGAGLVKGFAVTLALGVAVSMFTALTCSRTLLFVVLSFPGLRKPQWFCPNLPKTVNS
jgi:preprotein translocase subunit SecD